MSIHSGLMWESTVRINLFISEGDWIETEEESEVFLLFKNGSKLRICEDSRFTVTSCMDNQDGSRDVTSLIKLGSVICNIRKIAGGKGSFKLSTPTATCSIRGTLFETVVAMDGASTFNVLEGIVDVGLIGSNEMVQIKPNMQTKVTKDTKAIASTDIPAKEKAKLIQKAKKVAAPKELKPVIKKETKKEEESTASEEKDTEESEEESEEETTSEEDEDVEEETSEEDATDTQEEPQEETTADETTDLMDDITQDEVIEAEVSSELEEAKEFAKTLDIDDVKSGQWFITLLQKVIQSYDRSARAEYFQQDLLPTRYLQAHN